jgi:hypothetical protein
MDKIIQIVLNALKNAYTFLKEELIQKLLFYCFSKLLGFSKDYSTYLAAGTVLVIAGLMAPFKVIGSITINI